MSELVPWDPAEAAGSAEDRERERIEANRHHLDAFWAAGLAVGYDSHELGEIHGFLQEGHRIEELYRFLEHERRNGDSKKKPDLFEALSTFRARQVEDLPPRTWFAEGMVTPGFCVLTGKKAVGKSFFLAQLANAVAEGEPFLGRPTIRAKVLLVSFELDERDTADRFKTLPPLSENAMLLHTWSKGAKAFADAERAFIEFGFKLLIFDTFLPLIPVDGQFKLNEYSDTAYYLRWRTLAKQHGAAIVGSWHSGKADKEDLFLNMIGSTGMGAQCDSAIELKRKRGDWTGVISIAGNHAADSSIPFLFEDGIFHPNEGTAAVELLSPAETRCMEILADHPGGCTPSVVALGIGKSDAAARSILNRLIARGKVMKPARGIFAVPTLEVPA